MSERHTRQNNSGGSAPGRTDARPGRGGSATVGPSQMISCGGCWCGESFGHDWPGKADGAPHPREQRS